MITASATNKESMIHILIHELLSLCINSLKTYFIN